MWNVLLAFLFGHAVANSRSGQRILRPLLILFAAGVLMAGFVYVYVVLNAVSERNNIHHVSPHSSH
jgi:4-hydroxybenzoate polyprenyltransferase